MNRTTVLQARPKKTITRLNRNSKIFKTIIKALQDRKAEQVISLDLRKIPEAVADFFVVAEATTTVQVRAIADHIEDAVKKATGEIPYRHEGRQQLSWVLIDYVSIVVHIMQPDQRKFYRLEEMWSDAPLTEHND